GVAALCGRDGCEEFESGTCPCSYRDHRIRHRSTAWTERRRFWLFRNHDAVGHSPCCVVRPRYSCLAPGHRGGTLPAISFGVDRWGPPFGSITALRSVAVSSFPVGNGLWPLCWCISWDVARCNGAKNILPGPRTRIPRTIISQ